MTDPATPELPGLDPTPPEALVRVLLIGHLVHSARVWTPTHEQVALELLLRQRSTAHHQALPVVCRRLHPTHELAQVERLAAQLPAGTAVLVQGFGLDHYTSRVHGPVLRLLQVTQVSRLDRIEPHFNDAAHGTAAARALPPAHQIPQEIHA